VKQPLVALLIAAGIGLNSSAQTSDLKPKLALLRTTIAKGDLVDAYRRSQDFMQSVLLIPRQALNAPRARPLPSYRLQPGDTSLSVVDRIDQAIRTDDRASLRRLSLILPAAVNRELHASLPSPSENLAKTESTALKNPQKRYLALPDMAREALAAGDLAKASLYANELLAMTPVAPAGTGDAVFVGNTVLGEIALRSNDLSLAGTHLLESAKTTGSPRLRTFGPSLAFASEMLKDKQTSVVVEFLGECKTFWELDGGRIDHWISSIQQGVTPDFGMNLKF
jgi:hypothetical protein